MLSCLVEDVGCATADLPLEAGDCLVTRMSSCEKSRLGFLRLGVTGRRSSSSVATTLSVGRFFLGTFAEFVK